MQVAGLVYSTNNQGTCIALSVLDFGPNFRGGYRSCKYVPLLLMLPDQGAWLCGEKRYPSLNRKRGCPISPSDLHVFKYSPLKGYITTAFGWDIPNSESGEVLW